LSKAWLKGEADANSLALRPSEFYKTAAIDFRPSTRATAISRADRTVMLSGGDRLHYDHLILATGSRLRNLTIPGADLRGVVYLRTAADADRLKGLIAPGRTLAVVGGGYIGLEVAASARYLGASVVVIEMAPRVMARTSSVELSEFLQRYHRERGIRLELDARVAALTGRDGAVAGVTLADGRTIACDAVLVGIGADGNDALARQAALPCNDGIVVDAAARTSDPAVFAIGDCTNRPVPRYGRNARLESVHNATEQAKVAASVICGRPIPAQEVPWFWSDQFDLRMQMAGLHYDVAQRVIRGDPATTKFAIFHLAADGRLQAVEAVNSTAEYMAGRALITKAATIDPKRLADATLPAKQLLN
jgi:3-phenylpropionate/trans-cinnamate dioxygenase ferredoxin reductase subunit